MSEEKTEQRQTKTFNDSEFIFEVVLFNVQHGIVQEYSKDEILKLNLVRDLNDIYCSGEVLLKDFKNLYTVLTDNIGNWIISVTICQIQAVEEIPAATFNKAFLITSSMTEEIAKDYATVRIKFVDFVDQIFNKNIAYSSQNDKDICDVLQGLLEATGFYKNKEGVTKLPEFRKIGRPYNYITDTLNSAKSHIDFINSQIYSEEHGFQFLYYHPTKMRLAYIWTKDALKQTLDLQDPSKKYNDSAYYLSFTTSQNPSRFENTITQIKPYNFIDYTNSTRLIYPTYINSFNYAQNIVEKKESNMWNYDKFKNLFNTYQSDHAIIPGFLENPDSLVDDVKVFLPNNGEPQAYAFGNYYRDSNADRFYQQLRTYFIYGNIISVKLLGKIWREPGRMYFIDYQQITSMAKFHGPWFCTKIVDEFENQQYYQYIFLTRASDGLDLAAAKASTDEMINNIVKHIEKE